MKESQASTVRVKEITQIALPASKGAAQELMMKGLDLPFKSSENVVKENVGGHWGRAIDAVTAMSPNLVESNGEY